MKQFDIIPEYSFVLGLPASSEKAVKKQIDEDINFIREIKEINKGTPFEKISNSWLNKGFVVLAAATISTVVAALADPTRRNILARLAGEELTVTALAAP